ncbi:MAG: T9SS type A sorting domain-containing protein [Brumimicrobium sp.]
MLKTTSITLLTCLFCFGSYGQHIKRSSLGSIGNTIESSGVKLSQSVGQNSVHEKIGKENIVLRQGFQQPMESSRSERSKIIDMHIFPNPNEGNFTAILDLPRDEEFNYTITDSQGRIVQENIKTNIIENNFSFHASTQKGTYILRITTTDGKFGQAKIVVI